MDAKPKSLTMTVDADTSATVDVHLTCRGRDAKQEGVYQPLPVRLHVFRRGGSDLVELSVTCKHTSGSHGQNCDAGGICPYALDLPYAADQWYGSQQ
jgi:hypothetical protein